jgi:phenylacetate-coenzyme A ligase PaaK-like adenylate-forming protein
VDLPTTAKQQVRESQARREPGRPFGRHQGVELERIVQTVSSSGTTGDPVFFALTDLDLAVWKEAIAAAFWTAGVRRSDVAAHLVGLPGVAGGLPYADGLRTVGATLAWLGGLGTEKLVRALPAVQATVVLSTTSFGTYLADRCQELVGRGAESLGVRNLLGGGEPGLAQPEIREHIRTGWGLDHVHEIMGLGDVLPVLWAECDEEAGMHYCGQRSVIVELIDAETGAAVPWEEGAAGEAVYTTFAREATPALRYRSADHMLVSGVDCPCGRTSPRVRCIGRTDDMLIYKAMNVFPSAIRDVVVGRLGDRVRPYVRLWKDTADQVRFDDPIPIDVEADDRVTPAAYTDIAATAEAEVRQQLQVRVTATVVAPGTLPRSAYKTPLVGVRDAG